MLSRLTVALLICGSTAFSCHNTSVANSTSVLTKRAPDAPMDDPTDGSSSTTDTTSFTIPRDQWAASEFCGQETPPVPENPTPEYRFPNELITEKLSGAGLNGWIHGAVPEYGQYIFTYRKEDPNDFMAFFKSQQFTLIPTNDEVAQTLASLHRHDQIRLNGEIFENGSPIVHIFVSRIDVVRRYPLATENPYDQDFSAFNGKTNIELFGMVHAIVHSDTLGYAIVVEYKGLTLPVEINSRHEAEVGQLYRGDIVNLSLKIVRHSAGPLHFVTDDAKESAITVVDPMLNCHGVAKTVVGTLVKFNKSPAISTDVYAVRYVDRNGMARNFTFFPASQDQDVFTDVFMAISAKAKTVWDRGGGDPVVIRNFWEKAKIRVVARGTLNVVSTEQANAQVYINSADDVSFEILP